MAAVVAVDDDELGGKDGVPPLSGRIVGAVDAVVRVLVAVGIVEQVKKKVQSRKSGFT